MTSSVGSIVVVGGLFAMHAVWPGLAGQRLIDNIQYLAIAASISAIYGFVLYWLVRRKNETIASLASFVLFSGVIGLALQLGSHDIPTLSGLGVLLITIAGIYGWWLPLVLYFPILATFILEKTGIITSGISPDPVTMLVFTVATANSVALWIGHRAKNDQQAVITGALAENLKNERNKSDIILGAIEDGVVFVDVANTINLMNPAACAISGWNMDEVLGLDHHSVIQFIDEKGQPYPETDNPFTKAIATAATLRDNNAFLRSRTNKQVPVSINVTPLTGSDGQLSGVVAVFRDVSKERSQEKQRADFISTASHEMRTPVAAIEGYLALALNDKVCTVDNKAHDFLEKAHSSTKHLGQLFQDLLTSAKAEDGRLSNHPVVVEMGEFIEKLAEDLRFGAEKKKLLVEYAIGTPSKPGDNAMLRLVKPLYYAYVDPDRMREVITNLFDNGVKYTETGKITLGLTADDKTIQFHISDTGPGIPKDDIAHLFQKFYRVDNSSTRTIGGTGLGLFICRKIVELYNGQIWVESELNKGSTFYINLPRISSEQATRMQAEQIAVAPPVTIPTP